MNRFVRPNKDAAAMRESCAQGAFWSMPRTEEMVGSYFVESDATGKIVANKMQRHDKGNVSSKVISPHSLESRLLEVQESPQRHIPVCSFGAVPIEEHKREQNFLQLRSIESDSVVESILSFERVLSLELMNGRIANAKCEIASLGITFRNLPSIFRRFA
mmetsp:Transcript_9925/g.20640  ORF Transcript_9925/g.20640 Transcript_9925/m.20640 type:complete len:160 (+) Transcript_9925:173-652(+)